MTRIRASAVQHHAATRDTHQLRARRRASTGPGRTCGRAVATGRVLNRRGLLILIYLAQLINRKARPAFSFGLMSTRPTQRWAHHHSHSFHAPRHHPVTRRKPLEGRPPCRPQAERWPKKKTMERPGVQNSLTSPALGTTIFEYRVEPGRREHRKVPPCQTNHSSEGSQV